MASKTDIVVPKSVKVHELDSFEKLLKGIKVAACMLTESHQVVDEASVIRRLSALTLTLDGSAKAQCCSCCGAGPFESRAHQTAHYKHHWHTHNLKRKLFGKPALTLGQFNSRQDEGSSVSGSDSEEDTGPNPQGELFAAATRHCKAFFTNRAGQVFCVYRCLLHHRKEELSTDGEGSAWVERCSRLAIPGYQRWAVLMVSGGHFAGAIFAGSTPVVHKTFHSYVVRRGQGQAQGTRDSHGGAPKSAGASLRRYNQAQFMQHIRDIVIGWTEDLVGCSVVLCRAVGSTNQAAIFGKGSPLTREDPRVRVLPFPTRKPSFKEVQRVHDTVASVEVYDSMELFQRALIASRGTARAPADAKGSPARPPVKKKSLHKLDRAKSRERAPRELPTEIMSSEDEGPCYIDLETPADWIKTLSEQTSNGIITNSRKDLINDCSIATSGSDSEADESTKEQRGKKKKKKKAEGNGKPEVKKTQEKIPANIKQMWRAITGELATLQPVLEGWEGDLPAAVNAQDPADGNTALHKAAIASKPDMVTQLLSAGGDPCTRNTLLQTPYAAASQHDTRVAFRLFQAQFPDKYNYSKSQIPGPVTPELLEQEKERKAQQKRAKRLRDKEKQAEKAKTSKFLMLTDAQKVRALEPRCFLCGGGIPNGAFEYQEFRFCSTRCLQNHRNVRPLKMSA